MFAVTLVAVWLVAGALLGATGLGAVVPEPQGDGKLVRIGVLAKRGKDTCLERWRPHGDYLTRTVKEYRFEVVPLGFDEVESAVRRREVDLLFTNPSQYAQLDHEYGMPPLATLKSRRLGNTYAVYGGVILCKADRKDIQTLQDLRGKRFAAVDPESLGGWQMAWRELLSHGIDPHRDFADLRFPGTHDAVVFAVLNGEVDAGTVRTDALEWLASEGKLNPQDIRVLNPQPQTEEFPFLRSTVLYPDMPFSALPHVSTRLAEDVARALISMPEDSAAARAGGGAGWTIAQSYQPIHECLKDLRLEPYRDFGKITVTQLLRDHWPWIAGGVLIVLALFAFSVYVSRTNRQMRRMSQRLASSEERINATLHSIGDAVISTDNAGRVADMNEVAESLTGWPLKEARGRPMGEVFQIVNERTRETMANPVAQVLASGETVGLSNDTILISRDRGEVQIADSAAPIRDRNGEIMGVVLVFRDVSEEYRMRRELGKQNERFNQLAEQNRTYYWEVNRDGFYTYVSDSIEGIYGYRPEEVIGRMRYVDFLPEEVREDFTRAVQEVVENAKEFTNLIRPAQTRDGRIIWMESSGMPVRDADGSVDRFRGSAADVTERVKAEETLRISEARLRAITESAQDAIVMIDPAGDISFWNPGAERIFGYTGEEAIGQSLHKLLVPERYREAHYAAFARFLETGEGGVVGKTVDLDGIRCDGTEVPVELSLSALRLEGKWHAVGIMRDITERRQAEAKLAQSREELERANEALQASILRANDMAMAAESANIAKSQFLANMSHEIRTPMNGVIGMTGLLMDTDLDDDQRHYAEIVQSSGAALLDLINDILDFSKIEADRLELEELDFDLRTSMDEFAELLALRAQEKGVEFICGIDPDVPVLVRGDPGRLRQILINLTGNAIKFTSEGEVAVRVSLVSETEDNTTLRFAIQDTGIGIPHDKVGLLFNAFQQVDASTTRKFGGTGLGLAISKRLAELMGGEVGVESEEGKGSTFWFTATVGKQKITERPLPPQLESLKGKRMLIVDDNATNRQVLSLMLNSWGVPHEEADCGERAIELLHQAVREANPFVMAILDMQMPGMDGEALGKLVRNTPELRDTKLVMMTSIGRRGDALRFGSVGFSAYLTKPVKQSELHDTLATVLSGAAMARDEVGPEKLVTRHSIREDQRARYRILLAEDNIVNQKVGLKILEKLGYRADAVANGREAIAALEMTRYDIVLMDVQMPVMDGFEATEAVRACEEETQAPRLPIIAMTAHAMKGDRERCHERGMDDYVPKPVKPETLMEILEKWLPRQPGGTEPAREEAEPPEMVPHEERSEEVSSDDGVWDRSVLLERLMGDEELMVELVETALEDIPKQIKHIHESLEADDIPTAERVAHTIKGACANLGAEKLRAIAERQEHAGKAGNGVEMKERMPELEKAFEELRRAMTAN